MLHGQKLVSESPGFSVFELMYFFTVGYLYSVNPLTTLYFYNEIEIETRNATWKMLLWGHKYMYNRSALYLWEKGWSDWDKSPESLHYLAMTTFSIILFDFLRNRMGMERQFWSVFNFVCLPRRVSNVYFIEPISKTNDVSMLIHKGLKFSLYFLADSMA